MTSGKAAYIRELLEKRVGDLELSDLRFLKGESSKELFPPETRLVEVFGVKDQRQDTKSIAAKDRQ
jgi:hypothetical protein